MLVKWVVSIRLLCLGDFLKSMTASIQNLAIRHGVTQLSNADCHMTYITMQDNRVCVNKWNHVDTELLDGFSRNSGGLLPQRCHYDAQEIMVPQNDCSRIALSVSNGSHLGYSHQVLDTMQQLAVNKVTASGLNMKQVPTVWQPENRHLGVQEYQCFAENKEKPAQTWPVKDHSLAQASQKSGKHSRATGIHAAACFDAPGSVLECSSQIREEDVRVSRSLSKTSPDIWEDHAEPIHPLGGSPCRSSLIEHASNVVVPSSSTASIPPCGGLQPFKFPTVFPRTSRRRSFYWRQILKKVDEYADGTEGNIQSSSLENKGTELTSTSDSFGPIVESPNWLPPGWLTEMKTRASGSSAGCKYKCYVDPVTRRRFRTRKEVFCFLKTGNTGRYKPRPKVEQNGEQAERGHSKTSLDGPASQFPSTLHGPSMAGGIRINGSTFLPRSWHYRTGRSAYGDIVDIQAAALKLLTDDDDMTLDEKARLFARFSPRPIDLYGLRIPAKTCKRVKPQGKEGLEALGKVICQQGLSILRNCN